MLQRGPEVHAISQHANMQTILTPIFAAMMQSTFFFIFVDCAANFFPIDYKNMGILFCKKRMPMLLNGWSFCNKAAKFAQKLTASMLQNM